MKKEDLDPVLYQKCLDLAKELQAADVTFHFVVSTTPTASSTMFNGDETDLEHFHKGLLITRVKLAKARASNQVQDDSLGVL